MFGSFRSLPSNWSLPTSMAYISFIPFCIAQSENPPVEDPISHITLSFKSILNTPRAFSSFNPPLDTYLSNSPLIAIISASETLYEHLVINLSLQYIKPFLIIY